MTQKHLIIMAAGTGGHVIPGLAVAKEMQTRGWTISWLGTQKGMENKLVPPSGIPMDTIPFAGLRGNGLTHSLKGTWQLLSAFASCAQIIKKRKTSAVLGMGGYVCFPGGLMARLLRKPLMLVNADASLLMSNKALLPFAQGIAFGFDGAATLKLKNSSITGNPVRAEIEALPAPAQRFANRTGRLKLLVVGGSLGAKTLNDFVPQAIALMPAAQRPQVTHQTGAAHLSVVQMTYDQVDVHADVRPFITHMADQLAECDVIVCRAGAVTVSELCAAGVAAVLVPLVVSTTSHQRDNAQWMASHGAGIHLPQGELTARSLADLLMGLTRDTLLSMAEKARALAKPHAAQRVADRIEGMVAV